MPVQIVCAWCGQPLGSHPGNAKVSISHSICPNCEEKVRSEMDADSKSPIPKEKKGAPMP